ncbi:MAG: 3-deoxy-manno-octulosonate cytidylyltransferase [Bacteroidota bacterium]|nr:3-deoxy-manno-octulosonate cytidylyltransferase [Bacteroidota bacterium]
MTTIGIIPARYHSSRLPGKPLIDILGKSMIQRVYEQAKESIIDELIVAADDHRIEAEVMAFGGQVMMTSQKHKSGTDRCLEVLENINKKVDLVVNIQGDEPFICPSQINQLINAFDKPSIKIATLAKLIEDKSLLSDEHTPKVQFDSEFWATSFERVINNDLNKTHYKHIGLYAYRSNTLKEIALLQQSKTERQLNLEQCRWLDHHYSIKVLLTKLDAYSIDTLDDLKKVIQRFG